MKKSIAPVLLEREGKVFNWADRERLDAAPVYVMIGSRAIPAVGHPDGPKNFSYFQVFGHRTLGGAPVR
jgi:hypothetical protein